MVNLSRPFPGLSLSKSRGRFVVILNVYSDSFVRTMCCDPGGSADGDDVPVSVGPMGDAVSALWCGEPGDITRPLLTPATGDGLGHYAGITGLPQADCPRQTSLATLKRGQNRSHFFAFIRFRDLDLDKMHVVGAYPVVV